MSESVIADDLHIKGEIKTSGDIELKGSLEGELTCRTLLIAEDAKVKGKVTAEKVVVRGTVDGTISGVRVTLTSSAKVTGELICKALSIDEEAYFDGTSQRVNDPLRLAQEVEPGRKEHKPKAEEKPPSASAETSKPANVNLTPEKRPGDKLQPLAGSSGH